MLTLSNISFSYGADLLLSDISLKLNEGEVLSIVGESGEGKSTLLKCMAGLLSLNEGEIHLGKELVKGPKDQLVPGHDDIALVNQSFEEDEYFTVEENIKRKLLHLVSDQKEKFTAELLELFQLITIKDVKAGLLSGGEQQRLSMACALAKEPKVLLLDEPFAHMDVHLRKRVGKYLKDLCDRFSISVVLVTHEGEEALSWSDRICFMEKGKIKRCSTPQDAYHHPRTLKEGRFFGELNSVKIKGRQYLFRPNAYAFHGESYRKIELIFNYSEYRGFYWANYFKLANNREVVLYAEQPLKQISEVYVL